MTGHNIKNPLIIKNVLSLEDFNELQQHVKNLDKSSIGHSDQFNRYEFGGSDLLNTLHKKLATVAKDFFESDILVP